jgi:hypothetical protein
MTRRGRCNHTGAGKLIAAAAMSFACAGESGSRPHSTVAAVPTPSGSARNEPFATHTPVGDAGQERPQATPVTRAVEYVPATRDTGNESQPGATTAPLDPQRRDRDDAIKYPGRAFTPPPKSVQGTVFTHCAYGQTGYGEDPARDAKEVFDVLVLDRAIPELCPVTAYDYPPCEKNVAMLEIRPAGNAEPRAENLTGRRVRLAVSEYSPALTGHHHTRVVLFYHRADEVGPSPLRSLRSVWRAVAGDFRGVSCTGYPR